MLYNVYFLYAALVIMLLIIINSLFVHRAPGLRHPIFTLALVISFIDVLLDLITSYLMSYNQLQYLRLNFVLLTLFYICQVLIPYIFLVYAATLQSKDIHKIDRQTKILSIPTLILIIIVATNPLTKFIYYFDSDGNYVHGPIYYSIYIYAFIYMILILIKVLLKNHDDQNIVRGFFAYVLVSFIAVIYQMLNPNTLTIGFGMALGLIAVYFDINNPQSFSDYHTGLANNIAFTAWVARRKTQFYCVSFKIPNLGKMNHIYSMKIMNGVLKKASVFMASHSKGKTFSISASKLLSVFETKEDAFEFANELNNYFNTPLIIDNTSVKCNVTICIAEADNTLMRSSDLLPYIDYLQNECGILNHKIITDSEEFRNAFKYKKEIENYISEAISKDLFEIYLHPIFSVKENSFTAVEVLSRLKHPEFGYVSPELFMSIAEENGSIDEISYLQFKKLCSFLKENSELLEKLDGIKFNLSPHELVAHSHATLLPETIKRFDLPLNKFEFEITESVAIEYGDALLNSITTIKDFGIRLNMDDFGSGYANMNNVLRLPFDCIKIDKSLLLDIAKDSKSATFYKDLIDSFHRLGFLIVSEGIENEEEFNLIKDWGADMIQGFYLAKPMPALEALEFFKNN